jgi:hypothetical protein
MLFNKTIPDDTCDFDIMPFEDEIDAAIASDARVAAMEENLDDVEIDEPDYEFTDDTVDADDLEDASLEDYDAEEIAAAEKELISNPFEDDEVIDAAIGNDDGDDIEDIEESLNESLILLDDDDDF